MYLVGREDEDRVGVQQANWKVTVSKVSVLGNYMSA